MQLKFFILTFLFIQLYANEDWTKNLTPDHTFNYLILGPRPNGFIDQYKYVQKLELSVAIDTIVEAQYYLRLARERQKYGDAKEQHGQ
jgi:hypothetical protein